jgi:hypothetical protein
MQRERKEKVGSGSPPGITTPWSSPAEPAISSRSERSARSLPF